MKHFFDLASKDLDEFDGCHKSRNGQVELRDKWNKAPDLHAQDPDYFYEHEVGDSYLYDLAAWHSSGTLYPWGQIVQDYISGECWDFGGGIGTYSLIIASSPKVDVVYYDDINPHNREFAHWRFVKYKVLDKIKFGRPETKVESIVALDVIEHLADPFHWLAIFEALSLSGTKLVVNVTAHTSNGEHPMHVMGLDGARKFWTRVAREWDIVLPGSPSVWKKK